MDDVKNCVGNGCAKEIANIVYRVTSGDPVLKLRFVEIPPTDDDDKIATTIQVDFPLKHCSGCNRA